MRLLALAIVFLCSSASALAQAAVDAVRVVKSERKLYLLSSGVVVKDFRVTFGANPVGHKQQAGDERTPEGVYVLDHKKQESAFYKAIHISYPNAADVERARQRRVNPGGDIMIHGQKNGLGWLSVISQRFNWTDGCIALANEDMEQVWRLVSVGTPIEIVP